MDDRKKQSPWPWIVAGVVMLLVLYVLSTGPVVWLSSNGHLPEEVERVLVFLYIPLEWLQVNSVTANDLLNWYWAFWS